MNLDQLTKDLIRDEGFVSHAYEDTEGYITIGIGRMIDEKLRGGITLDEAEYLLTNDISRVMRELNRNYPWWREMSEPRQRALANMCFNLGITRLSKFKKMLAALQIEDYEKAVIEALDSKWAKDVGHRANRIAALIRDGE